jgi:plasmid stabilization system protein ParE
MRISLSEEALADLEAATDWYLEQLAFAAADDFANEFEHALALLGAFPELGVTSQYKTRAFTLPKFPYSLICRVFPDYIRIIAVAHHSRCPGYWAGRR